MIEDEVDDIILSIEGILLDPVLDTSIKHYIIKSIIDRYKNNKLNIDK